MRIFIFAGLMFSISMVKSQKIVELGNVKWIRNLEEAKKKATTEHKPILILFQEVPGCSTCKNYGNNVLSHPLIVEIIEQYFIPLCIYNNKTGEDKKVLDYFSEPAWNNPVVRIVNDKLSEIGERLNGNYSTLGLLMAIEGALIKSNVKIPKYFELLKEEEHAAFVGAKQITVGMYCFWSGEKVFSQHKGVIKTEAGFMLGSEVVEVYYNPQITNEDEIVKFGQQYRCADKVYSNSNKAKNSNTDKKLEFTKDKESKYYLYHSDWAFVPMTAMQAMHANGALAKGASPSEFFSTKQKHWFKLIHEKKIQPKQKIFNHAIVEAWYLFETQNKI